MDFDKKSSEFLVMAAAIVPHWLPFIHEDFFSHVRSLCKVQAKGVPKFQRCSDKLKFVLSRMMPQYGIQTVHVVLHKPSMVGTHIGRNPNAMYSYLLKLTLERVSWAVRDRQDGGDPCNGKCRVLFSENAGLAYDKMGEYLAKLKAETGHNHSIKWEFLHLDDAEPQPHQNETCFHFADVAASATFTAFDTANREHGITDDRYIRLLIPGMCRDKKSVYGFKFFPKDAPIDDRELFDVLRLLT